MSRPSREPLTLPGAHKRLEAAGSAEDPIWLMIGGDPGVETSVSRVYYDAMVKRGCQDMAGNLQLRFRGRLGRPRPDDLPQDRKTYLLEGTLLDMVREREGHAHSAVPVPPREVAGRVRGVEGHRTDKDLLEKAQEVSRMRGDVLLGGYGRKGAHKRHLQLALNALEQAEIWLRAAAGGGAE